MKELELKIERFEYPSNDNAEAFVLKDIQLSAKQGELIGIVGQSGCGKSTMLKILATDIITEQASISLLCQSGERLNFSGGNQKHLLEYKSQVSIVSQESHVFSSSVQFNISLSYHEQPEIKEFWEQVEKEIPYVKKWGLKLNDQIVPKELSLGQKQLLSALRSCYLTKPIVLFDEISSGLDSELEEALRKLVLWIQKNSLTFIVAHRIETIIHANQILVLRGGEVVGQGCHKEMLASSAPYQEFISQLGSEQ